MIVLTPAQARDLRYLVALYRLTVGWAGAKAIPAAEGDSVRTGRALARKGLVGPAAWQFNNRVGRWIPTAAGIEYVETNFVRHDIFWKKAVERAIAALEVRA